MVTELLLSVTCIAPCPGLGQYPLPQVPVILTFPRAGAGQRQSHIGTGHAEWPQLASSGIPSPNSH